MVLIKKEERKYMKSNIGKLKINRLVRTPFILESFAFAVIPFEEVLTLPIGSVLRFINLLVILFSLFETSKIKIQTRKKPVLPMLIFLFYVAISYLWCYNRTFYFDRLSTYGMYGILILLLCSLKPTKDEKIIMLNGLTLGGIIASLMIIFSGAATNIGGRDTLIIFGRMIDPNILAYSCVISLSICIYRLLVEKHNLTINMISSVLLIMGIVICGSRGALIASLITMVLCTLNIQAKRYKIFKRFFIFICMTLIILFVYFEFILKSDFSTRFSFANLIGQGNMGTANRDKIWSAAFKQIAKRPIFGYGNGSSMYAIEAVYRYYGTHNSYIFVLLEFGIVGFVLVFVWQLREFLGCCMNECKIYKILFLTTLIFVMFIEGFSTKVFWGMHVLLMTSCYGENLIKTTEYIRQGEFNEN